MKIEQNNFRITELQWIALIVGVLLGVAVTTLPRELAEATGRDGWITILMATGLILIYSYICLIYARMFPTYTLTESTKIVLGKWVGTMAICIFALYNLAIAAVVIRSFLEIVQVYFHVIAPKWAEAFLPLIVVVYMASCGMPTVVRMAEITFMLTIPFVFLLVYPTTQGELFNALPVLKEGILRPISALPLAYFAFTTIETIILVFYPYLKKKNKATKLTFLGVILVGLIYAMVFLTGLLVLGVEQLQIFYWPLIETLKTIRVAIVERVDNAFLYFWAAKTTMVASIIYFASVFTLSKLTHKVKTNHLSIILCPLVLFIAVYPTRIVDLENMVADITLYGGSFAIVLPIILIITAKIRGININ